MLLNEDYFSAYQLTGYARRSLAERQANQPSLARYLPYEELDDLVFQFTRGGEGLTEAATFRGWDTPAPVASRPGVTKVYGELAPISRQYRVDERTRLRERANRDENAVANRIFSDVERLVKSIEMRLEKARADALVTGKVTINENGVAAEVDFGRAAGHTVSAGTAWTDATNADALSDLRAWCDVYEATNGVMPGRILTSRRVVRLIMAQAKVRAHLATAFGAPASINRSQIDNTLEAWELPPIEVYAVNYRVGTTTTPIIPDDKVLLLPAPTDDEGESELGKTLYGTTAEALEPNYNLADNDLGMPGIVAGNYVTQDPVALWTKASAVALPYLMNPDLSFAADVAA
jgi:hypothetical protein